MLKLPAVSSWLIMSMEVLLEQQVQVIHVLMQQNMVLDLILIENKLLVDVPQLFKVPNYLLVQIRFITNLENWRKILLILT